MKAFDLSRAAERDLQEIARFTFRRWGPTQVSKYRDHLSNRLDDIAAGALIGKPFSEKLPNVLVVHVQRHFMFYEQANRDRPLILAILHEKRDLVARLAERLARDDS
ncbi:MAG: type II toxin-antitoxin system RelE/ParE family toxin [Wenzhouxiangella sp.]|nr:type II toxin-antitoxin system RelE/ParE family toxin [Wenzhouxiangella sp.]